MCSGRVPRRGRLLGADTRRATANTRGLARPVRRCGCCRTKFPVSSFCKIFFPAVDDNVGVLVNHGLDALQVAGLDVLLLAQHELFAVPVVDGQPAVALHVDVYRIASHAIPRLGKTSKLALHSLS